MTETINRYGRQELIDGWDQTKLANASIGIIGSGHISNFLTVSLAALGVGDIRIYDNERVDNQITGRSYDKREFLLSQSREGNSKVEELEKKVQEINPLIDVSGIHMSLDKISGNLIERPDMLITTTNNKETIRDYRKFATREDIPLYVVLGNEKKAQFFECRKGVRIPDYDGKEQEGVTSEVISGLLVGEVIQNLMFERQLKNLSYKPTEERFSGTARSINLAPLENKKALIVGAGALGNFLGLGLTHTNLSDIYLVDDDVIETTNLNRQIMFYNAVGEYKAEVLAKRINEINPNVRVHPIMERVNENFEDQIKTINPDVLIDCVDNLGTRAVLNHFAIRYGIPLISGGTDYNAGQVVVYEPGKSSCLDCKLGTDRALLQERQSMSCMNAPTQSVVITNHIIGGLMAAETRCVLSPGDYGPAVRKTIKYDSTKGARIGLIGTQEPCKCERGITAQTWIKNLESKAS